MSLYTKVAIKCPLVAAPPAVVLAVMFIGAIAKK
jgi:hypothetical protein